MVLDSSCILLIVKLHAQLSHLDTKLCDTFKSLANSFCDKPRFFLSAMIAYEISAMILPTAISSSVKHENNSLLFVADSILSFRLKLIYLLNSYYGFSYCSCIIAWRFFEYGAQKNHVIVFCCKIKDNTWVSFTPWITDWI